MNPREHILRRFARAWPERTQRWDRAVDRGAFAATVAELRLMLDESLLASIRADRGGRYVIATLSMDGVRLVREAAARLDDDGGDPAPDRVCEGVAGWSDPPMPSRGSARRRSVPNVPADL